MKFIHTADWHLGKTLYGRRLLEDQAHVLGQLENHVREHQPDALVVAGDVYDRTNPGADAMRLFEETVSRITGEMGVPTIVIPGNHDSADRVGLFGKLLAGSKLYLNGPITPHLEPLILNDSHGPVEFWSLPFLYPAKVREVLNDPTVVDHVTATQAVIRTMLARPSKARRVLVGHAFVTGGSTCESEEIFVGTAVNVPSAVFKDFNYVALGHLHQAQTLGAPAVGSYSGSILKYSPSEVSHIKGVNLVELAADGTAQTTQLPLHPLRNLRVLTGMFNEFLTPPSEDLRDDYIVARYDDERPIANAMQALRAVYPNALHITRNQPVATVAGQVAQRDVRKLDVSQLFSEFWQAQTGAPLAPELLTLFNDVVEEVRNEENH